MLVEQLNKSVTMVTNCCMENIFVSVKTNLCGKKVGQAKNCTKKEQWKEERKMKEK